MYKLKKKNYMAELMLILVALAWGIGFPVMKEALVVYPAMVILWMRFALAAIIIGIFSYRKLKLLFDNKLLIAGIVLGVLLFISFAFLITGLEDSTAVNTGFLASLFVIFVPMFERVFLKNNLRAGTKIGIVFSIGGIFVISHGSLDNFGIGELLVFFGAIFTAIHIICLDLFGKRHDTTLLTLLQLFVVSFLSYVFTIKTGLDPFVHTVSFALIKVLVITSVFATALAFWVQTTYQHQTTPARSAIIYSLEPVFTVIFSVLLLGEVVDGYVMLGGSMVILAVLVSELW